MRLVTLPLHDGGQLQPLHRFDAVRLKDAPRETETNQTHPYTFHDSLYLEGHLHKIGSVVHLA